MALVTPGPELTVYLPIRKGRTRNAVLFKMAVKPRIESEQLDAIYRKWVLDNGGHKSNYFSYDRDVNRVNLTYGLGKQFDEYLWACGGRIGKEHGKRYAEFFEESDMIMFSLRHL